MKYFTAILLLLFLIKVQGQESKYITDSLAFDTQVITAEQIPKELKYDNNIQFALKWNDKEGECYFITTISDTRFNKTKPVDKDTTEFWEKNSYNVYLYRTNREQGTKPWLVNEDWRAISCRNGVLISVVKESVSVRDIDNDSIAEVTFALRLRCKKDNMPSYTNILLNIFEFEDRYSIEGMGLEDKTKNKKLTLNNICCFDTLGLIYIDSLHSPKAQGRISDLSEFKGISKFSINRDTSKENKENSIFFLEYGKKTWIEIVKKEFEEYQEIKKLRK